MKFLKNLGLSLLGFLLFLALSIFGSAFMLNQTLLNPDFVTAEINRLDVSSLAGEILSEQIPVEEFPEELRTVLVNTITDVEPWMKEEISTAVYSGYDYLMGKTQSLNLIISTQPVRDSLKENLREAFQTLSPPELQGLPPAVKEQYFNEFYQQLAKDIPPTIEFTESSLPPEALAMLEQVKQYISYYQTVYYGLIGLMVLLVVGIILISRQVRDVTRRLGTPCLTYGAVGYAGIFATKYFIGAGGLPLPEIPASLQTWLPQFLDNLLAPMEIFSLGLLITGIVLIIVSFVYKPRQPSS